MKLLLPILVLLVFALSFWADHKWRQWMKTRRSSHLDPNHPDSNRR
jgi:hypothetical protein